MAERAVMVDLYCEDAGHELFVRALLLRLGREQRVPIHLKVRNARGGHGQAVTTFRAWQSAASPLLGDRTPDLLVVVIDANCDGWHAARQRLEQLIEPRIFPRSVVGCPEPHIERWCIADPESFVQVVGGAAPPDPGKCERDLYKRLLRESIETAGQLILTSEMEWAPKLVAAMDLYRAGKRQRSLRHFADGVRSALREL